MHESVEQRKYYSATKNDFLNDLRAIQKELINV